MIQDYNNDVLAANVREKAVQQNVEQQHIYDNVMRTVDEGTGGLFFIYTPGGYVVLNLCILSFFLVVDRRLFDVSRAHQICSS